MPTSEHIRITSDAGLADFPDSTVTDFRVRCEPAVQLADIHAKYEVGLAEISFSNVVYALHADDEDSKISLRVRGKNIPLPEEILQPHPKTDYQIYDEIQETLVRGDVNAVKLATVTSTNVPKDAPALTQQTITKLTGHLQRQLNQITVDLAATLQDSAGLQAERMQTAWNQVGKHIAGLRETERNFANLVGASSRATTRMIEGIKQSVRNESIAIQKILKSVQSSVTKDLSKKFAELGQFEDTQKINVELKKLLENIVSIQKDALDEREKQANFRKLIQDDVHMHGKIEDIERIRTRYIHALRELETMEKDLRARLKEQYGNYLQFTEGWGEEVAEDRFEEKLKVLEDELKRENKHTKPIKDAIAQLTLEFRRSLGVTKEIITSTGYLIGDFVESTILIDFEDLVLPSHKQIPLDLVVVRKLSKLLKEKGKPHFILPISNATTYSSKDIFRFLNELNHAIQVEMEGVGRKRNRIYVTYDPMLNRMRLVGYTENETMFWRFPNNVAKILGFSPSAVYQYSKHHIAPYAPDLSSLGKGDSTQLLGNIEFHFIKEEEQEITFEKFISRGVKLDIQWTPYHGIYLSARHGFTQAGFNFLSDLFPAEAQSNVERKKRNAPIQSEGEDSIGGKRGKRDTVFVTDSNTVYFTLDAFTPLEEVLMYINLKLESAYKMKSPLFYYHAAQKKIFMRPTFDDIRTSDLVLQYELQFGSRVASLLGFESDHPYILSRPYLAKHRPNLSGGVDFISVYVPMLTGAQVASVGRLPILRMLPFQPQAENTRSHFIFTHPYYLPLERAQIDEIHVMLRDQMGRKILFREGKLFLTLHLQSKFV
jgi:hypothetical protein